MENNSSNVQILRKWLNESRNTVFFGGAGVSTESNIPDFRSSSGLYKMKYPYPPEKILSHSFFYQHMDVFYKFYKEKMMYLDAEPNLAHKSLVKLEQEKKLHSVITQNIDGLHQKAGSENVIELHGSIHRNYCQDCHRSFRAEDIKESTGIPRCECGGIIKPDVVLYEEPLNEKIWIEAIEEIEQADLLIIGGTSLAVYPAASLIRMFNGDHMVLINKESTSMDSKADLIVSEQIGDFLNKVTENFDN